MSVFLFGVAIGWAVTFALWTVGSAGFVSGVFLGALVGTATIFLFFLVQWLASLLAKTHVHGDSITRQSMRSDPEKVAYRS
jgi:hypothetical protein